MQTIFPLPTILTDKIAAGEVVERPVSIVKELIENSLDAQATQITIELQEGGKKQIIVTDNGQGIALADLCLLGQRHHTSKIKSETDFQNISTLGFRGEALHSLLAVCQLEVFTRHHTSQKGWQISWNQGQVQKPVPKALDQGTKIKVSQIFQNFPARLKFLKSNRSELNQITKLVTTYALSHSKVDWKLRNDNQEILHFPVKNASQRLLPTLGEDIAKQLLPIKFELPRFKVNGWIGRPPLASRHANWQYIFINHRPVRHEEISRVVKQSYRHLLEPRSQPVFVLELIIPPETLDWHVHPRKEEVLIYNQNLLFEMLETSILQTLFPQDIEDQPPIEAQRLAWIKEASTTSAPAQILRDIVLPASSANTPEPILQINKLFLALNHERGLLLIDQHAAHERILYEQFRQAFEDQLPNHSLKLQKPLTWKVGASEHQLLSQHLATLEQIGFKLQPHSQKWLITTVPQLLAGRDIITILRDTLTDLEQESRPQLVNEPTHLMLSYLACRSAIKGGDYLDEKQRLDLVTQLAKLPSNYTCPHGRPLQTFIEHQQLGKFFDRHSTDSNPNKQNQRKLRHDLANKLAGILANAELLELELTDQKPSSNIKNMTKQIQKIKQQVKEINTRLKDEL